MNLSDHALNTYLTADMLQLTKGMLPLAETMSNRPRAFDAMNVGSDKERHAWPGRHRMRLMARWQDTIKVKI